MTTDLTIPVSAMATGAICHLVLVYARSHNWTVEQKKLIPRIAPMIGGAIGSAVAVLMDSGDWHTILRALVYGAVAGWSATGIHESAP